MTTAEKILRIMQLALEINPPEIEDIGMKKTAVFVYYFPHIPSLEVHIYPSGWQSKKPFETYDVSTHEDDKSKLDKIIAMLEKIKERESDVH